MTPSSIVTIISSKLKSKRPLTRLTPPAFFFTVDDNGNRTSGLLMAVERYRDCVKAADVKSGCVCSYYGDDNHSIEIVDVEITIKDKK